MSAQIKSGFREDLGNSPLVPCLLCSQHPFPAAHIRLVWSAVSEHCRLPSSSPSFCHKHLVHCALTTAHSSPDILIILFSAPVRFALCNRSVLSSAARPFIPRGTRAFCSKALSIVPSASSSLHAQRLAHVCPRCPLYSAQTTLSMTWPLGLLSPGSWLLASWTAPS